MYVNDYEVFRPYLVRSGQQEGLSFINPELTRNVSFYNGGFQAKYGDKMSSALDIQYRKPKSFGGSAYIGLLEQGLHLEGSSKNNRFTYLFGVRNRTNKNLLSSQETQGSYVPSSADLQGLLTYQLNDKWSFELFGNASKTKFTLIPEFSQLSSSIFTPYFTANLGLDIFFEGREEDRYVTGMVGLTANQQVKKNLRLKWMVSRFEDKEEESIDITGAYLFGEREFDKSKADFGLITNPLGAGVYQNFARNNLNIVVWNFSHKGYLDKGRHYIQWGQNVDQQSTHDRLNEWELQDSAGYTLPYNPSQLVLSKVIKSTADLNITRLSGYIQDNILLKDSTGASIQAGLRYNYNTLNNEFLLSPRAGISWRPMRWKKDIIFKAATGIYVQPPFYRELRRYDGTINEDLKAQKSVQVTAGMDYNFQTGDRPFRFTAEAYYKYMWDVVPYDIDNVRIRYFGENMAKAFATGIEFRLFGELVKDAESWVSLGFMKTMEDFETIKVERPDLTIARIVMNRPEARNAQNLQMTYDLNAAFDSAVLDDAIKVIILAGNGPHFSSGHDLRPGGKNVAGVDFPPVGNWGGFAEPNAHGRFAREQEIYLQITRRWRNLAKPTIAEVHGKCIAGGLMLAWACDLIVASHDAEFCDPVVTMTVLTS